MASDAHLDNAAGIAAHRALGFQDETPISHYAKFLVSLDAMMGDAEHHMTSYLT